jgi:hypothetical protein
MNWLWINLPLMAVFFIAMTAIPLWLTFRRPDSGPNAMATVRGTGRRAARSSAARPALVAAAVAQTPAEQVWLANVSDARVCEVVGASR